MEGKIVLLCDTSPQVMILPTSIFDFMQETNDFYFPPLTGSYLRLIRTLILLFSVLVTPLWYLAIDYAELLPEALKFLVPDEPGFIPIILQLFLSELAIDGLKIASMNTPDMLSNSLSIVGALILGDFAVSVGWLSDDTILYMAFVAIANFAQQNYELGYAFKFWRITLIAMTAIFGFAGFSVATAFFIFVLCSNRNQNRNFLYPFSPADKKGIIKFFIRTDRGKE